MARRERNIYYREKEKRYEARFIKGRDENGKAVYGAVYAKTYAEVKERRDERLSAIRLEAVPSMGAKATVGEVLIVHLAGLKDHVKPATYNLYQHYITAYISPKLGNVRCDRLTQVMAQNFINDLLQGGLSATTVQSAFKFARAGLGGKVAPNVFEVKIPKPPSKDVEVLTIDEQKRLETAARASDDINHVSVTLMLYTGLRVGEVTALSWNDIDFERKTLHVRHTLQRVKNIDGGDNVPAAKTFVTLLSPKTRSSERVIPLPSFLVPMLGDSKERNGGEFVLSRDGSPVEPRSLQMRFKKLLGAAGVRDIGVHGLRHTFSARALESGTDIATLASLLGHANIGITLSTYAHTLDETKRKSVEALASIYQ